MGGSTGGRRCYRLLSALDRALDLALYLVIAARFYDLFSASRAIRDLFSPFPKRFSTKGKFYDVFPDIGFIYKFEEPDFCFIILENN